MDQEMQEYLALKAAVKGEIRSAQGRTWRRQIQETVHTVIVQPVKDHPIIAGEIFAGIGAVLGVLAAPAIGIAIVTAGQHLAGWVTAGMIERGGEQAAMAQAFVPIRHVFKAIGVVASTVILVKAVVIMMTGRL